MTQWCVLRVGLYAVLAVGFLPKMNCSKHALAHALIKMIAKNFLGRDYLVCANCKYYVFLLFYFAMKSYPVELWAEFHQFEPFGIVSSVFSCCIARDSRAAFFSSSCCSAFGAFECDNDANAFAFGHNNSVYFWE